MKPGEGSEIRLLDRISPLAKWVWGAAFLAAPLTTLRPVGSVTLGDVFLALAFGLALIILLLKRRLPPVPRLLWAGCGILLVAIAITVIWQPASVTALAEAFDPSPYGSTISAGLRLMVALVALPVAVALIVDRWSTIGFLLNAWIIGATLSCLVAVIDAFTGSGIQEFFADDPELLSIFQNGVPPRFMGLSVHPTSFSITGAMVVPLVLAKIDNPAAALRFSPVLLILVLGVILTGSRVGILGLVLIVALYFCVSSNLRRVIFSSLPTLALAVGVALAGALLFFLGPPVDPADKDWYEVIPVEVPVPAEPTTEPQVVRPDTGTATRFDPSTLGSDTSSNERLQRFEDSLDFIRERPFTGYGFEWIEASHSIYLQLLVSGGILALIGFLVAFWSYAQAWRTAWRRAPDAYREITLGLGVSAAGFLIIGAAQTDLLDRYVYLPVGLILAAYALLSGGPAKADPEDSDRPA